MLNRTKYHASYNFQGNHNLHHNQKGEFFNQLTFKAKQLYPGYKSLIKLPQQFRNVAIGSRDLPETNTKPSQNYVASSLPTTNPVNTLNFHRSNNNITVTGSYNFYSNMIVNNKTFSDIKNEFILFLRNKLAQSSATNLNHFSTTAAATKSKTITTTTTTKTITRRIEPFIISSCTTFRQIFSSKPDTNVFLANEFVYDNETFIYFKYHRNSSDELMNIWKLAFFLLTFIIGLISLLVILTLTIKIIFKKIQKNKQQFCLGHHSSELTTLSTFQKKLPQLQLHQLSSHRPAKQQQHVSSISLFEYNASGFSTSKFNLIPKTIANATQARTRALSLSSITSDATLNHNTRLVNNPAVESLRSTVKSNDLAHQLKQSSPLKYGSHPNITDLDDRFIKSSSMIESIFDSNRTFAAVENEGFQEAVACNVRHEEYSGGNGAAVYTISRGNTIHSTTPSTANKESASCVRGRRIEVAGFEQKDSMMIPWRFATSNSEYQLAAEGEAYLVENLSSATTYSNIYEERRSDDQEEEEDSYSYSYNNNNNKTNINNNSSYNVNLTSEINDIDLINSTSIENFEKIKCDAASKKMTKELEMKLRERRLDRMETGKFKPTIIQENEIDKLKNMKTVADFNKLKQNQTLPLPSVNKMPNKLSDSNERYLKTLYYTKPAIKYEIVNKEDQLQLQMTKEADSNNREATQPITSYSCRNAKIVIDNPHKLPAVKRESIKLLIDNKLVTENRKKTDLEDQLNSLLRCKVYNKPSY